MSLRGIMRPREKTVWLVVAFALMVVELRSLSVDKAERDQQWSNAWNQENAHFSTTFSQSQFLWAEVSADKLTTRGTLDALTDKQRQAEKAGNSAEVARLTDEKKAILRQAKMRERQLLSKAAVADADQLRSMRNEWERRTISEVGAFNMRWEQTNPDIRVQHQGEATKERDQIRQRLTDIFTSMGMTTLEACDAVKQDMLQQIPVEQWTESDKRWASVPFKTVKAPEFLVIANYLTDLAGRLTQEPTI